MHGKRLLLSLFTVLTIVLIIVGCRRYFSESALTTDPVKKARKWFHKKFDSRLRINSEGLLTDGNKYPDWKNVRSYQSKYFTVVETPLLEDIKPVFRFQSDSVSDSHKITSLRKLIICQAKTGMREAIMTIIPRREYLAAHADLSDITIANIPKDFSGIIYFESFNGLFLRGFEFKKGIISVRLTRNPAKNTTASRTMMNFVYTEIVVANCWHTVYHYDGETDQLVSYISTYFEALCTNNSFFVDMSNCSTYENPFCECDSQDIIWETCGMPGGIGGPGAGQGEEFDPEVDYDNIIVSQLLRDSFPCLDSLLRFELPNPNYIAQYQLSNTFFTNAHVNLLFDISPTMNADSPIAKTVTQYGWVDDDNVFHFTGKVLFNKYYMEHATKEVKVATIAHESIHAFINYVFEAYRRFEVDSNFVKLYFPIHWKHFTGLSPSAETQHKIIADWYTDYIENLVKEHYNPAASDAKKNRYSEALAWGGLAQHAGWTGLAHNSYIWDTCKIKAINFAAENAAGSVGNSINNPGCSSIYMPYTDSLKQTAPCK